MFRTLPQGTGFDGAQELMKARTAALLELGRALQASQYSFTAVTPSTHARVVKRQRQATSIRDVFGWNLPFAADLLPPAVLELAHRAEVLKDTGDKLRATVRFATLGGRLFVHGAYPTTAADSVFFGPDSYRFCTLIQRELNPCRRLVDIGCGSGVGGIVASDRAEQVLLTDINETALELTRVNAALAGLRVDVRLSDVLSSVEEPIDAVLANPPYMRDNAGRTYRDGGGSLGEGLALRIVEESLSRLAPGGQLILYTGAPIVDGVDVFRRQVEPLCRDLRATFDYFEIDPDVFGEELDQPAYTSVERIAAVGLRAVMPG